MTGPELDEREFGVAPQLVEVRPEGVCLTTAGLLKKLGVKSKTSLYVRFPDVIEMRRGLGPDGGAPFRWIEAEVDKWLAKRPKGRRKTTQGHAAGIAKTHSVRGSAKATSRAKQLDETLRAQMQAKLIPQPIILEPTDAVD